VKVWRYVFRTLVLAGLLPVQVLAEDPVGLGVEHASAFEQMELLAEVLVQVRRHYVEERSYKELLEGAIQGMLGALDPHSAFLDAEAYEGLLEDTSGAYGGIGIQIGMRDNILTVIAPIEDTPAFRAGVQSGDRIVAIDGESTMGIGLREAVRLLRGTKGTSVRLTVMGRGASEEQEIEIVRDRIEVASVKGARLLEDGIGYVRLTQFDAPATGNLRTALEDLSAQGMQALVLDLRGNPGGLLQQAVETASLFLAPALTVVSTRGRGDADRDAVFRSQGGSFTNLPLVVLVNGGSASAAEIVAGAIQDHRRGILIGDTTYGKASVQTVLQMGSGEGNAAIRLTTAYYHTPLDRQIHEHGIDPDIRIPLEREEWRRVQVRRAHLESPGAYPEEEIADYTDVVDRPLQRARDLLVALLIFGKSA